MLSGATLPSLSLPISVAPDKHWDWGCWLLCSPKMPLLLCAAKMNMLFAGKTSQGMQKTGDSADYDGRR
jgi:hypothetical protein